MSWVLLPSPRDESGRWPLPPEAESLWMSNDPNTPTRTKSTPSASSLAARSRMEHQRRRDTKPEVAIRSRLHGLGLRFRVDRPVLTGMRRRADVLFPRERIAVFVDGCFWHGCPEHGTWPKANAEWWRTKIETNRHRDADTDSRLTTAGWVSIRIWEHEDAGLAAARVASIVQKRREQ